MTTVNISDLVNKSIQFSINDSIEYAINRDSKLHLSLLYHYLLKQIFDLKKKDKDTIFLITSLDHIDLSDKIKQKVTTFISNLQQLIPSIITTQNPETYHDPIFSNILINISKKSTTKKVDFRKLKKFCKKHGLTLILNSYLSDPTYQYVISA